MFVQSLVSPGREKEFSYLLYQHIFLSIPEFRDMPELTLSLHGLSDYGHAESPPLKYYNKEEKQKAEDKKPVFFPVTDYKALFRQPMQRKSELRHIAKFGI